MRIALRVVPHRGDGVAVVVAHHQALGLVRILLAARYVFAVEPLLHLRRTQDAGVARKRVHQSGVEGTLLGGVVVVLVRGCGLRARQAERLGRILSVDLGVDRNWGCAPAASSSAH